MTSRLRIPLRLNRINIPVDGYWVDGINLGLPDGYYLAGQQVPLPVGKDQNWILYEDWESGYIFPDRWELTNSEGGHVLYEVVPEENRLYFTPETGTDLLTRLRMLTDVAPGTEFLFECGLDDHPFPSSGSLYVAGSISFEDEPTDVAWRNLSRLQVSNTSTERASYELRVDDVVEESSNVDGNKANEHLIYMVVTDTFGKWRTETLIYDVDADSTRVDTNGLVGREFYRAPNGKLLFDIYLRNQVPSSVDPTKRPWIGKVYVRNPRSARDGYYQGGQHYGWHPALINPVVRQEFDLTVFRSNVASSDFVPVGSPVGYWESSGIFDTPASQTDAGRKPLRTYNGLFFDGLNDALSIPKNRFFRQAHNTGGAGTAWAWFTFVDHTEDRLSCIMGNNRHTATQNGFILFTDNRESVPEYERSARFLLGRGMAGAHYDFGASAVFTHNGPHFFLVTWDVEGTAELWVNGIQRASATSVNASNTADSTHPLYIGNVIDSPEAPFHGTIHGVGFFPGKLPVSTIEHLYAYRKPLSLPHIPTGYWRDQEYLGIPNGYFAEGVKVDLQDGLWVGEVLRQGFYVGDVPPDPFMITGFGGAVSFSEPEPVFFDLDEDPIP
jgi:hypothetical protein